LPDCLQPSFEILFNLKILLKEKSFLSENSNGTIKILFTPISADFSRIQFTPDLMPSDILGTSVFNVKTSEFEFNRGPIFSNIILIDEINRAPAKTQSALLKKFIAAAISKSPRTILT
jgi:hypothetical protein